MKKNVISLWEMCLRTYNFLSGKPTIVGSIVGVSAALTALGTKIAAVAELRLLWEETTKGTTIDKKLVQDDLIKACKGRIAILIAYATLTDKTAMAREFLGLQGKIASSGAMDLIARASRVYEVTQANLAQLADWNMTAALQTEFKTKIDAFTEVQSLPRQKAVQRSQYRKQFEAKTKELLEDLKKMDHFVGAALSSNPGFVAEYKQIRIIVDAPKTKKAAILKVLDATTNAPLEKVRLITNFGTFRSTSRGNIILPTGSEGSHSVKLVRPGCVDCEATLVLISGVTTKQTFYLQAA